MLFRKVKGILAVFFICMAFTLFAGQIPYFTATKNTGMNQIGYILDAGHGLPDGGAVGVDGTTEQELNLKITLKISEILQQKSIAHELTRSDENSIFTDGESIHAKKVSDIKARIKIAEKNIETPIISIHMNSYPNSSVHGIQVFYKNQDEISNQLAQALQLRLNQELQPDNAKTVKAISKNIYLFSHIKNPAILIECGFLSNENEISKLKSEEYQNKLAEVIADVLCSQG